MLNKHLNYSLFFVSPAITPVLTPYLRFWNCSVLPNLLCVSSQNDPVSAFVAFLLEVNDCPIPENKRLIVSSAHITKTKSVLIQSLHFSKKQSGFWEITHHFEEWTIGTLMIREIRLIGSECDVRVCSLMKIAAWSGYRQM